MSHIQLFRKSDNPDDPIRIIAHVGRHVDALKAMGFVETEAETREQEAGEQKRRPGRPPKDSTE